MKRNFRLNTLLLALITGNVIWGGTVVHAEEPNQKFILDPMVVTATRYEKRDVDVPASTTVLTGQELKDTGANNLGVALSKVPGVAYKQFGPAGASMGTMINEVNIRGVSNGTLILVNGNPVSWRGKYNLDAIAVDNIERVEIVKSGGSVLYGSEAMGGVVNIILKKKGSNAVGVGFGNRGQQNYNASVGNEKFTIGYSLDKFGKVTGISESDVEYKTPKKFDSNTPTTLKGVTKTDADKVEKNNISLGYNITDNLNLSYNYFETKVDYVRLFDNVEVGDGTSVGDLFNARTYTSKQHSAQLNYNDNNIKAGLYFNQADIKANGPSYYNTTSSSKDYGKKKFSMYNTEEKNRTYGADLQKNWDIGDKSKAIFGMTYQREFYDKSVYADGDDYSRNNLAVYGQWEQVLDKKNTIILGARETWTNGAPGGQNYNNFSAAGQYIHKLDEDQSLYASVTQSFIMPTFAQMYGASDTAIANPDLKPQTGINYEIGWKKVSDSHSWKAALYHIDITDNISATWSKDKSEYQYTNEDFKNTGIELTCDIAGKDGFSYNWGINYGDPKVKGSGASAKKPYWDRKFGRVQLNGGITYSKDKWRSSLTASYLADRVGTPSSSHSEKIKPYLLTSLSTTYQMDKHSDITLTMDNILNRKDNLSHSGGSAYYATPFNFLLSYNYKF